MESRSNPSFATLRLVFIVGVVTDTPLGDKGDKLLNLGCCLVRGVLGTLESAAASSSPTFSPVDVRRGLTPLVLLRTLFLSLTFLS